MKLHHKLLRLYRRWLLARARKNTRKQFGNVQFSQPPDTRVLLDRLTDSALIARMEADKTVTIPVKQLPNEQDWEFVLLDYGNGKKGFSVF